MGPPAAIEELGPHSGDASPFNRRRILALQPCEAHDGAKVVHNEQKLGSGAQVTGGLLPQAPAPLTRRLILRGMDVLCTYNTLPCRRHNADWRGSRQVRQDSYPKTPSTTLYEVVSSQSRAAVAESLVYHKVARPYGDMEAW